MPLFFRVAIYSVKGEMFPSHMHTHVQCTHIVFQMRKSEHWTIMRLSLLPLEVVSLKVCPSCLVWAGVPSRTPGCWCIVAGGATVMRGYFGGLSYVGVLRPHSTWIQAGPWEALGGSSSVVRWPVDRPYPPQPPRVQVVHACLSRVF